MIATSTSSSSSSSSLLVVFGLVIAIVGAIALLWRRCERWRRRRSRSRRSRIVGGVDIDIDIDDDHDRRRRRRCRRRPKTMAILGSGGHTSEMMRLLDVLDPNRYGDVVYVLADTDATSLPRLMMERSMKTMADMGGDGGGGRRRNGRRNGRNGRRGCEEEDDDDDGEDDHYCEVHRLPRAREVNQSYVTSFFTTTRSFVSTFALLWKVRPDLIVANGPGTCVPVMYASFVLRVVASTILLLLHPLLGDETWTSFRRCRLVFVESVCRVRTLSLSGRMLYPIVDLFVVHWPYLTERYPSAIVSDVFVRHDDGDRRVVDE